MSFQWRIGSGNDRAAQADLVFVQHQRLPGRDCALWAQETHGKRAVRLRHHLARAVTRLERHAGATGATGATRAPAAAPDA